MGVIILGVIIVIVLFFVLGPKPIDNILKTLITAYEESNIPLDSEHKLTLEDGQKIHFYFLNKIETSSLTPVEGAIVNALKRLTIPPMIDMNLATVIALVSIIMKQSHGLPIVKKHYEKDSKVIEKKLGYKPSTEVLDDLGTAFGYTIL